VNRGASCPGDLHDDLARRKASEAEGTVLACLGSQVTEEPVLAHGSQHGCHRYARPRTAVDIDDPPGNPQPTSRGEFNDRLPSGRYDDAILLLGLESGGPDHDSVFTGSDTGYENAPLGFGPRDIRAVWPPISVCLFSEEDESGSGCNAAGGQIDEDAH